MAIAEHHPSQLYARNRGMLKMSKGDLHKFSTTKEARLPKKKKKMTLRDAEKEYGRQRSAG